MKRLWVNMALILCFALLGYYCYTAGKSYKILFENLPYEVSGQSYPAIEAMQIRLDGTHEPVLLLDGDRILVPVTGQEHTATVEALDENDDVVLVKMISFSVSDLGTPPTLNVAKILAGLPSTSKKNE